MHEDQKKSVFGVLSINMLAESEDRELDESPSATLTQICQLLPSDWTIPVHKNTEIQFQPVKHQPAGLCPW